VVVEGFRRNNESGWNEGDGRRDGEIVRKLKSKNLKVKIAS